MVTKETNRNPMTIHGDRGPVTKLWFPRTWSGYVVVARGTRRPSPRNQRANTEEAHRAQSAPRGALRGQSRLDA